MGWGGGEQKGVVNDQSCSSHKKNILTALFLSSSSPGFAPLCAHRHPEPTCLAMEKVFYCNLSPSKCKPYNLLATCSGFGSLLKTSSISSYKTQPCAETLQAAHLLTISLPEISILRHFQENGEPLPQCIHPQKQPQVFPVFSLMNSILNVIISHIIFPQSHWK